MRERKRVILNPEYKVIALHTGKDCAQFTHEGMENGLRKNPNRPVSLISLKARHTVDHALHRGLCYKKFQADITLDCDEMPPKGVVLGVGDLKLGILSERKRCWPECTMLEQNRPCPLIEGVRYAWVEAPGSLCCGDRLKILIKK